jgi:CubicO group peptidase (beta-lactamase class C family)
MNLARSISPNPAHTILRCGLAVIAAAFLAVEAQADRVDRFIESQLKKQEIPGLAVAVVRDGKVAKAKGYGLADAD